MQRKTKSLMHYTITLLVFICFFSSILLVSADGNEQGLAAYYNFDDGEGNTALGMSGNCNDGIIYGANWTDGKFGKALEFDGKDDCVEILHDNPLNPTDAITIIAYVKFNSFSGKGWVNSIYNKGAQESNNHQWLAYWEGQGAWYWELGNGNQRRFVFYFHKPEINQWYHVAGTYNASSECFKVYIDGAKVKEQCYPGFGKIGVNGLNAYIGGYRRDGHLFNGTIDEVKLYNRALTENEIKLQYDYQFKYDSLKPIDSVCSSNSDCKTNNCFKGVCKNTIYCENNSGCYSCHYCDSEKNKCRTLKPTGEACLNDFECKTNNCLNGICRAEGYCNSDSDCTQSEYCENNKCEILKPIGFNCTKHSQCETKTCVKGKCRETGYCNSDSDCTQSEYCENNKCENLKEVNSPCLRDRECKTKNCIRGVCKNKGYCDSDSDCYSTQYCKNNKCENLKSEGASCSKDKECKTKNCYYETCREEGYVKIWSFIITIFALTFTAILFFLPGLAFSLIKSEIPLHERICAAVGLSISLNILGIFVLNHFLNVPINFSTLVFYILFISGFFLLIYYIKERKELKEKFTGFNFNIYEKINEFTEDKIKNLKVIILLAALIFIFNLHYGVHSDYGFPYHTDEWQHLARAVQIMDNNDIPDVDPFFNKYSVGAMEFEIGFHVFLAEVFILSHQDPVLFYKFLPAIFVILASLMLFILVKKITNNFYAGIFSMLFFASLKSAITILGVWFFVPLSMCFMLIFLFFYLFMEGMRKNSVSYFLFAAITISGIALIHPQSASWIYPVMLLYLAVFAARNILKINLKNILRFKNLIIGNLMLFFLPFLSFIYFFKILWKDNFETTLAYFVTEFIVFRGCPEERGVCEPEFIINFYGEIAVILAGIGIIYLLYKFIKNKGDNKFKIPLLLSWIAVMAFLISLLHVESTGKFVAYLMGIDYSPFVLLTGYIRVIYEAMLCLAALSGIGLYAILRLVYNFSPRPYRLTSKNFAFAALSIIIIIFIFNSVFTGYYDSKPKLYKDIDAGDYEAIKWIEENYGNYNIIFARPHISETIYPISRNYVVSITPHSGIPTTGDRLWYTNRFFMGDCKTKEQVLNKYEVDYVLVKYRIKCDFLEEIYHEERYVYEFKGKNS